MEKFLTLRTQKKPIEFRLEGQVIEGWEGIALLQVGESTFCDSGLMDLVELEEQPTKCHFDFDVELMDVNSLELFIEL
jgi:FKBP-type peptidyl-prolyl cis-trans isomerase